MVPFPVSQAKALLAYRFIDAVAAQNSRSLYGNDVDSCGSGDRGMTVATILPTAPVLDDQGDHRIAV